MANIKKFVTINERIGRELCLRHFPSLKFDFAEYQFCEIDFNCRSIKTNIAYVGDVKSYTDREQFRSATKFHNYQIDFNKLYHIKKEALNHKKVPLLIVFFSDMLVVWDLTDIPWENRGEWKRVTKQGGNYGEKEWDYQTYLYLDEAKVKKEFDIISEAEEIRNGMQE